MLFPSLEKKGSLINFSSALSFSSNELSVRATYLLTVLGALSSVPSQAADCSRCAALWCFLFFFPPPPNVIDPSSSGATLRLMLLYRVEPVDCQKLCRLSYVGGELPKDIGGWVGGEQGRWRGGGKMVKIGWQTRLSSDHDIYKPCMWIPELECLAPLRVQRRVQMFMWKILGWWPFFFFKVYLKDLIPATSRSQQRPIAQSTNDTLFGFSGEKAKAFAGKFSHVFFTKQIEIKKSEKIFRIQRGYSGNRLNMEKMKQITH